MPGGINKIIPSTPLSIVQGIGNVSISGARQTMKIAQRAPNVPPAASGIGKAVAKYCSYHLSDKFASSKETVMKRLHAPNVDSTCNQVEARLTNSLNDWDGKVHFLGYKDGQNTPYKSDLEKMKQWLPWLDNVALEAEDGARKLGSSFRKRVNTLACDSVKHNGNHIMDKPGVAHAFQNANDASLSTALSNNEALFKSIFSTNQPMPAGLSRLCAKIEDAINQSQHGDNEKKLVRDCIFACIFTRLLFNGLIDAGKKIDATGAIHNQAESTQLNKMGLESFGLFARDILFNRDLGQTGDWENQALQGAHQNNLYSQFQAYCDALVRMDKNMDMLV